MTNPSDIVIRNKYNPDHQPSKGLRNFIVTIVLMVILGGLFGYYYRFHLLWKYSEWRFGLQTAKIIPNSPMYEVDIPNDWVECSLGCLRFRLPPDLAASEDVTKKKNDLIVFQNSSYTIIITLSPIDGDFHTVLNLASSFIPDSKDSLTLPRLRLECCKAGADNFHWCMAPHNVSQNSFFINLRPLFVIDEAKKAEVFFQNDIDRIAVFYEKRAMIDWQSTTTSITGSIHVFYRSENPKNDSSLTQRICQSITLVTVKQ